ncbi:hypothetical protein EDB85DRAFT_1898185 [Lactarius pseudohatsudake]|nr:hypothetical protein EDB85DRAFT_1898185 [Lactarius pseudohatsudake]
MSSASTFDEPVIDYDELAGSDNIGTYPIDPSPSSLLPSGVSVETVARLTHDELLHNAEFTKQVHLVAALQELLEFRSKTTPNEKVLWTLADCKVDAEVNASPGNLSRPPMLRAIRREDGTLVNDDDWKAMRQSAVLIVCTCILPLDVTPYYKYFTEQVEKSNAKGTKKSRKKPRESTTQQAKVKKTFYKRFFFKEWFTALQELESAVPLMLLCARYWKADMTLRSALPDIRVNLPTPATSHVGTSSRAATPFNASWAPYSQSSVPPPARSQSSRPPPAPRSQSSMPPPTPHVRSSVPSRTTHPCPRPVASRPATPPSPFPTPSDSSRAAASHSEPSAHRDSSKAPQPSASCAPPAKKAGTKGKRSRLVSVHDRKRDTHHRKVRRGESMMMTRSRTLDEVGLLRPDPLSSRLSSPALRLSSWQDRLSFLDSRWLSDSHSHCPSLLFNHRAHPQLPSTQDQQTSRTTRAKSAMQAGDHVTSGEEAGTDNVAARQWESSPLPPSRPTTPKPKLNPTTTIYQDNGNGDDEGDKHSGGESGSGDGDGDGLLATLKRDDLIAWIAAHDIEPQGKWATKKEIIKAIMAAAKSEHPSKEDVEEIIKSRQAKRNMRTA